MSIFSLTQKERLKKKNDFIRVYKNANVYKTKWTNLYVLKNSLPINRIGISISKRNIAKTTIRNRIRRLIKECYRINKRHIKAGFDLIFVIRSKDIIIDFKSIYSNLECLFKKAGLLLYEE